MKRKGWASEFLPSLSADHCLLLVVRSKGLICHLTHVRLSQSQKSNDSNYTLLEYFKGATRTLKKIGFRLFYLPINRDSPLCKERR